MIRTMMEEENGRRFWGFEYFSFWAVGFDLALAGQAIDSSAYLGARTYSFDTTYADGAADRSTEETFLGTD